jgi:hypothetical protein
LNIGTSIQKKWPLAFADKRSLINEPRGHFGRALKGLSVNGSISMRMIVAITTRETGQPNEPG